MPFKIVQTIEKEENKFLAVVPDAWKFKGALKWPPPNVKKGIDKDEHSKPQVGWTDMICVLKRKNFNTYEAALKELNAMKTNSDTDYSTNAPPAKRKKNMLKNKHSETSSTNAFNSLFNSIREPDKLMKTQTEPIVSILDEDHYQVSPISNCDNPSSNATLLVRKPVMISLTIIIKMYVIFDN